MRRAGLSADKQMRLQFAFTKQKVFKMSTLFPLVNCSVENVLQSGI